LVASPSANHVLIAALRAEEVALQEFKTLLASEQNAIIAGDIESLNAISQSKLELVERLNRLSAERMQGIAALGLSADRTSMEGWAEKAGSEALTAWHEMLDAAQAAHQANKINGTLIQTHLQHNQQTLSALLAAANQASLYGPNGQATNPPVGSSGARGIIGKA